MKKVNAVAKFYTRDFITIENEYRIEILKLIDRKELKLGRVSVSNIEKVLENKARELLHRSSANIDFVELQVALDSTTAVIGISKYRSVPSSIKFLTPKPTKLKKLGLVTIRSIRIRENEVLEQPIFIDPGLTPSWEASDIVWIEDIDLENIYVYEGIVEVLTEEQDKALIMITEDGETLIIPSITRVIARPRKPRRRRLRKRRKRRKKRKRRRKS
ncbi:MAG: hypothetical protein DRO15_05125 [Thermoprotei archaeon]|nr:MAG: hypothetical protein DRO15_05125 [Thermoprotei archaeon]